MSTARNSKNFCQTAGADHDSLWNFSSGHYEWLSGVISEHLAARPEHMVVDLGAGTGYFLQKLSREVSFANPPVAVEPDPEMARIAKRRTGIRCIDVTAEQYLASPSKTDRFLLKEMIHHVLDRQTLWSGIRSALNPGGRAVVITRPQVPGIPFFDKAMEAFARGQPGIDTLLSEIESAGLIPEFHEVSMSMSLEKERWLTMLKSRFSTNLNSLSDDDIESGVREIEQKYPCRVIDFHEHLVVITASRPSVHGHSAVVQIR